MANPAEDVKENRENSIIPEITIEEENAQVGKVRVDLQKLFIIRKTKVWGSF